MGLLAQINWVDIFVIIVLFRICYIAVEHGLTVEIFKLLGTLAATYLSLHYFIVLSSFIRLKTGAGDALTDILNIFSFIALASFSYLIFVFLRKFILKLFKIESVSDLNKWGGVVLGLFRGVMLLGLIISAALVSRIGYLDKSIHSSYLGKRLSVVSPAAYNWLWQGVFSKFMINEEFNSDYYANREGKRKK